MHRTGIIVALAACSAPVATHTPTVAKHAPAEVPMSEPAEYDIERISRAAGEAIFTRTGIGDPYRAGVPYPVFLALLRAFPQTFGADTAALAHRFGFVARTADPKSDDADIRAGLPFGMHLTKDPITTVPFVMTNCALCHVERLRWEGAETVVVGLGNKHVRIHDYDAAFATITKQSGFSVEKISRLAAEAAKEHDIAWPTEYADALVAATLQNLRDRAEQRADLRAATVAGPPGRVATLEAFVPALEQLSGKHIPFAPQVGWAKVPDVIGFRNRVTLSWDASGQGPMDVLAVEADIAAGVRVAWFDRHPFQGPSLGAFLRQPSKRPRFPVRLDPKLVDRGRELFEERCSDCHGKYDRDGDVLEYDEEIVALADIGTDPARANAATDAFEKVAGDPALTRGYTTFRRTYGYVPPVLTNVWARAPFGHAGQWPSLAVMAMPPDKRPTKFIMNLDGNYDLGNVGIAIRSGDGASGDGEYLQDATKPGLSVAGHPFLADLGPDARAVIEYLKSL